MRRKTVWQLFLVAALSGGLHASAHAQQLKPYFLVIVDTSGSMEWCAGGTQAQNGAEDCQCRSNPNLACATTPGSTRPAANLFKTNRCGLPQNRIGDAKCALQRIIDGTGGDASFGLMQFEQPCNGTCGAPISADGCKNNGTPACDDGQLLVEIKDGNATTMRQWVDGVAGPGTCNAATHNFPHELQTGLWTPIAKSLQRANQYLRGNVPGDFSWATDSNTPPTSPLPTSDPQLACRPVSVILLTDGEDTCANNKDTDPPAAAMALNSGDLKATTRAGKAFKTYVIGFGTAAGFNPTVLDNIATQGGTDSPDPAHKYFPAMNESELSRALNQIIADSQPPQEICNNVDDDCDIKIDEGVPKFCDKPHGVIEATLCDEPNESECDGKDDDCDGIIDEGLTNACGKCGPLDKEVCDNVDNDCDSKVDEGTTTQNMCGNDKGECMGGKLICTGGVEQCTGEIGPSKEVCDCKDNDCDGLVDEEGPGLCPGAQRCDGCECHEFCQKIEEFDVRCPPGLAPEFKASGECLCIKDTCDHTACPKSTIERDGVAQCAPSDARVAECQCRAGACVPRCTGVTCESGKTCSPKSGKCVEDNCRGLGCVSGELCDPMSVRCVKDECAGVKCEAEEVCRAGKCETSCAKVQCKAKERCEHGSCVEDICSQFVCESGMVCDPAGKGGCEADRCASIVCPSGQACDIGSGACATEPCWNVKCPANQSCVGGECVVGGKPNKPSTPDAPAPSVDPGNRLLATGGGGCACDITGNTRARTAPRSLWLLLTTLALLTLRRRRRLAHSPRAFWLMTVLIALGLGGCKVSPLCIDCVEKPKPIDSGQDEELGGSGGSAGSSGLQDGGAERDAAADSGTDPMQTQDGAVHCEPTAETCNNKDDDCDLKVDEGVAPTTNSCNQVGACTGTAPVCASGSFVCRYPMPFEMTETLCDGIDNDCDGKVDETFPKLGENCDVGTGACRVSGKQRCNAAHTGLLCEVKNAPGATAEICNGKDDDCDGMVDEPKTMPGANPSYVQDEVVKINDNLWIYKYEASRVDADANKQGIITARTCSRPGVLPWTNVTYDEALKACDSIGMKVCALNDWLTACKGSSTSCKWSFTPASGTCDEYESKGSNGCNGHDIAAASGTPDTDALKPTGAKAECFASFGGDARVFDLSGNAKEWTTGDQSPTTNPLRGGSYNNSPMGMRCDFDYTVGAANLRLLNVGFRCCSNTEP